MEGRGHGGLTPGGSAPLAFRSRPTDQRHRVKYVSLDAFRAAAATPSGLDALAASLGTTPEQLAVRAAFPVEVVKEADPAAPISFVISTETPDRERDSIKVDGWDLNAYRRSPTVLFAHDYTSLPIGRAPGIHVEDGKLKSGPIAWVPAEVYPFAETCRQMVSLGFLNAASVGFRPLKAAFNEERRGMDFERQELLEFSIVPVPANADCLVEARAAGLNVEPLREWAAKTLERLGGVAVRIGPGEVLLPFLKTTTAGNPTGITYSFSSTPGSATTVEARADECPAGEDCPMRDKAGHEDCPRGDQCPMAGKGGAPGALEKPFPNEHACRLRDPGDFQDGSFRRTEREHEGKTYAVIMGRLTGEDTLSEQAYRYPKDTWTADAARSHCGSHDGSFEAATGGEAAPGATAKGGDPMRWNRQLSRAFDVAAEPLEPADTEYAWISRYLEVSVKDIHQGGTLVHSCRMGSFLSALDEVLAPWTTESIRNMTGRGTEAPPRYETIRLNSARSRDFLVEGTRFLRRWDGTRAVIRLEPRWYGLDLTTFAAFEQREVTGELLRLTWERARQLNFLKGEAFSLGGEFLTRTELDWDALFLDDKNLAPLRRATELLVAKGAGLESRGILLMGPPGTGKTLSGRVMMNQARGATFIWLAARDFYYAGAMGGLAQAFDLAEECAPSILFIEDVDTYLDASSVDLVKTEMDGVRQRMGVLTVLTTNFPHRIPDALIDRPGRFHDVLELRLPDEALRARMLAAWLPELDARARATTAKAAAGFSGAHLRELVRFALVLQEEERLALEQAVARAVEKVRDQRALIDDVRRRERAYRPGRAARAAVGRARVGDLGAVIAKRAPGEDDLVVVEVIDAAEDEDTGIRADDLLAALREGIGAQAEASVRRALNAALGRVD